LGLTAAALRPGPDHGVVSEVVAEAKVVAAAISDAGSAEASQSKD
jgi:hypothetical protein